jgi:hypothetical protein
VIGDLCERQLIRVTPYRRLEANEEGFEGWQKIK